MSFANRKNVSDSSLSPRQILTQNERKATASSYTETNFDRLEIARKDHTLEAWEL